MVEEFRRLVEQIDAAKNKFQTPRDASYVAARVELLAAELGSILPPNLEVSIKQEPKILPYRDFTYDQIAGVIIKPDVRIPIRGMTRRLMDHFVVNPNEELPYESIFTSVWFDRPFTSHSRNSLKTYVRYLRRAIEPVPTSPRYIENIPWVGYRFNTITDLT